MIFNVSLFLLGICLGSFVNALVWRLHNSYSGKSKKRGNKYSIISGRSMCPECEHELAWFDLIPIFSWVFLKGKCRYCSKLISIQYPIVELLLGIAYLISYVAWPYELNNEGIFRLIIWLIALVLLTAMFVYDMKWMKLPSVLLYGLIAVGTFQIICVAIFFDGGWNSIFQAIIAVLIGGGIFQVIYWASNGKAIGDGDSVLGYGYSLVLGVPLLAFLSLTFASVIGSVVAIYLMIGKRAKASTKVPFGPFLILGAFIAGLWGQQIWDSLMNWMVF